ncbi:SpoIIIAH-like family protein [Alicyclobacillaceae bacterium I2511]|nr:SpoIIIAH-like family protein [Alicyclobacillaceae bacterium I2511]
MVKRQTVWLSTMMVLSLMLIGYYTMNSENPGSSGTNAGSTVTTTTVQPSSGSGKSGSSSSTTASSTAVTSGQGTSSQTSTATGTDWYVNMQTQLEQQLAQQMDSYNQVIDNNNSSSDQIAQSQQKLNDLQTLSAELSNARDMILAKGFKDSVIIPASQSDQPVVVYVKASQQITRTQAVEVMSIVSEQLNIPITNVVVRQKN